jgi:hypothetical protein
MRLVRGLLAVLTWVLAVVLGLVALLLCATLSCCRWGSLSSATRDGCSERVCG